MKDTYSNVSGSTDAGEDISKSKDGGTRKVIIKHGDSSDTPHEGATCTVIIVGRRANGQVVFEEKELTFKMGEGSEHGIVRAVERALRRFKRGERARIQVLGTTRYQRGPILADLVRGQPGVAVPPEASPTVDENETMVIYDVELKDFQQTKEHWELSATDRLIAAEAFKTRGTEFFKTGQYRLAKKNYKKVLQYIGTPASFGKPTVNIPADGTEVQPEKTTFSPRMSRGTSSETDQCEVEQKSQLLLASHLNLALCYLKLENNLKALDSCDRALEMEPRSNKGLYRRGQAHLAMDNLDAAVQDFTAVLSIDPRNSLAQQQLAIAKQRLAQYTVEQRSVYAGMFTKFAAFDSTREEEKNRGKADVFSEVGEWSNELAKDMMTLEQEMAAFGEVMPQPKYGNNAADSKEGENEPLDSDSDC